MGPKDYLRASNGSGEAVMAVVTTERTIGSATLITDSVLNWPSRGIATSGTLDPDTGLIDPDTATVFKYHLDGSIIMIDDYAPGYPDVGNEEDQVVVVKPTTYWADLLSDAIQEPGLPPGGTTGQILTKLSATDGDAGWDTPSTDADTLDGYHLSAILEAIYPVGSIYIGSTDGTMPALIASIGTWVRVEGRVIVGVSDSDTDFDYNDTGGAKTVTLTANQSGLRAHTHQTKKGGAAGGDGSGVAWSSTATTNAAQDSGVTGGASSALEAHNNLQPFKAKYMWERTA